ncbi:metal dependent phosphohydrolase [Formivibrio citricus]|uniref:Metal dependent phosphohydrolase n=1 Tax=Formivibrio citricus TaxID=83765 RepID=A0A1I5A4Z0_9NEIS|nr:HD domain-containing phosphohydrolase [Formivibrio citricus]SFN57279.1 metal dependent phosphohydrolase [Formivibrio citricus]
MESDNPTYNTLYNYTKSLSVALGYRDLMTRLHSERVRDIALELGMQCGLNKQELLILRISASFHDVGKIGIPDSILLKPTQLDDAEWEIMKRHAEIGEQIMKSTELEGSGQAALEIRHHHERYDGHGYPDSLAGEAIPIGSRIISIADSYDAMAVTRSYHRARAHAEIMDVLHAENGGKHDPELMRVFGGIIEKSRLKAAC